MKLHYVENLVESDRKIMNILAPIDGDQINGQRFADELKFLEEIKGVKHVEVRINSPGGSIMEAMSIFTAIRSSRINVITHVVGVAASSAGIIALAGKTRRMNDFARIMTHEPSIGPDALSSLHEDDPNRAMLQNFRDMIVSMITSQSTLRREEVETIIDNETWFTANEAFQNGFIDEVVSTNRQLPTFITNQAMKLNSVYNYYDNILKTDPNKKQNKMLKVANLLKLNADASEEAIVSEVTKLQTANNTLTVDLKTASTELETATNKITELETNAAVSSKLNATTTVENLIKEGRIDASKKDSLIDMATNNAEAFGVFVGSLKEVHNNITDKISKVDLTNVSNAKDGLPENKKDWTYRDWDKKDNKGLMDMKNNMPDLYITLFTEQYNVAPNDVKIAD